MLVTLPTLTSSAEYYRFSFPSTWTLNAAVESSYTLTFSSDEAIHWHDPLDGGVNHLPAAGFAVFRGAFETFDAGVSWVNESTRVGAIRVTAVKTACSPSNTPSQSRTTDHNPKRHGYAQRIQKRNSDPHALGDAEPERDPQPKPISNAVRVAQPIRLSDAIVDVLTIRDIEHVFNSVRNDDSQCLSEQHADAESGQEHARLVNAVVHAIAERHFVSERDNAAVEVQVADGQLERQR